MKKVLATLVLVLVVSFSYGQGKSIEKMAEINTNEMVKVLSLDADQQSAILKINVEKQTELAENKSNKSLTKEEKKVARKAIYKKAQNAFRASVGNDKIKEWNVFKNAQTAARKKKQ